MSYFKPYLLRKRAFFNPQLLRKVAFDFYDAAKEDIINFSKELNKNYRQYQKQRQSAIDENTKNLSTGPQPMKNGFKNPNTNDAGVRASRGNLNMYIQKGSLDMPNSTYQVAFPGNKNVSPGWHTLTNKSVPYYDIMRNIWSRVQQGNLTNKQFLNMKAGRDDYYDLYKQHLRNLPAEALTNAGVYALPENEMDAYANSPVPQPIIQKADRSNAFYRAFGGGIVLMRPPNPKWRDPNVVQMGNNSDQDIDIQPVSENSEADNGASFSHENIHRSNIMPIVQMIDINPYSGKSLRDTFPNLNPVVTPYTALINFDNSLVNNMYSGAVSGNDSLAQYRLGTGTPQQPAINLPAKAYNVLKNTIDTEKLKAYKGFDPSKVADPSFTTAQISQLSNNGLDAAGRPLIEHAYAFNAREIHQGNSSLNQGQSALQQAIRRDPTPFLQAGATQEEIDEFLQLPIFPTTTDAVDQRFEFYQQHPLFQKFLGSEQARNIDRYFWLLGESQNKQQSPQYRKAIQDVLVFFRNSGIVMDNNRNMNPVRSGMAQYMVNTLGQAPRVWG